MNRKMSGRDWFSELITEDIVYDSSLPLHFRPHVFCTSHSDYGLRHSENGKTTLPRLHWRGTVVLHDPLRSLSKDMQYRLNVLSCECSSPPAILQLFWKPLCVQPPRHPCSKCFPLTRFLSESTRRPSFPSRFICFFERLASTSSICGS